jgi:type IV secretory pathway VirB6-like protein
MASIRDLAEKTPFAGDYTGRAFLNETPTQRKARSKAAHKVAVAREAKRKNRSTMSHRQARDLELAGHSVEIFVQFEIALIDGVKYRLTST